MISLRQLLIILCCSLFAHSATALDAQTLEHRTNALAERLRCLVCQNQSIAESRSDLANDLRAQVQEQLAKGKSEQQVLDYMVERYGDFVLYDPPFKLTTLFLWAGPFSLGLIALSAFAWTLKKRRQTAQLTTTDAAATARARQLLEDPLE